RARVAGPNGGRGPVPRRRAPGPVALRARSGDARGPVSAQPEPHSCLRAARRPASRRPRPRSDVAVPAGVLLDGPRAQSRRTGLLPPARPGAALLLPEPAPLALGAIPSLARAGGAQRPAGQGRPVLRGRGRSGAGVEPSRSGNPQIAKSKVEDWI